MQTQIINTFLNGLDTELIDDQDISAYINSLTDNEFYSVSDNRANYTERIQYIINLHDPKSITKTYKKLKLSVRDMTNLEFARSKHAELQKHLRQQNMEWEAYKQKNSVQPRPYRDIDIEYDELHNKLEEAKKNLKDYIAPRLGRYVAPSARKDLPLDVHGQRLQNAISALDAKIIKIEEDIKRDDLIWETKQRDEYFMLF